MASAGDPSDAPALMWFRRDLRIHDLPALAEAASAPSILPCFVFDDRLASGGRFASPAESASCSAASKSFGLHCGTSAPI
ncbi:MAG: deoxyribodipyrimidine photo-lyase [Solirubrobacterales bacterium]|nr:deoxyribodipyrimidine photo-lyase [Solirubrobacterales bacterium]